MYFEHKDTIVQHASTLSWPLENGQTLSLTVSLEMHNCDPQYPRSTDPVVVLDPKQLPAGYAFEQDGYSLNQSITLPDGRVGVIAGRNGIRLIRDGVAVRFIQPRSNDFQVGKQCVCYMERSPGEQLRFPTESARKYYE